MPKFERDNLVRNSQSTLDSLFVVGHMEQLGVDEHQKLGRIYENLENMVEEIQDLVSSIEARKKKEREAIPIKRNYNGPSFSWADHEERAKLRSEIRKAEAELAKIEHELG